LSFRRHRKRFTSPDEKIFRQNMPIKTKNCKIFILSIILVYLSVFTVTSTDFQPVFLVKIALALPNPCEMVAGDSRVVEVLWYSGHDNLIFDNFTLVTERGLIWKITPPDIAKIDNYGRLETIRPGIIKITATSTADSNVSESRLINIIANSSHSDNYVKRVINYSLRPSNPVENFQKMVEMISGDAVKKDNDIPDEQYNKKYNLPNGTRIRGSMEWIVVGSINYR